MTQNRLGPNEMSNRVLVERNYAVGIARAHVRAFYGVQVVAFLRPLFLVFALARV